MVTDKRNRLSSDSIQSIMCLQSWNRLSKQATMPIFSEQAEDDVFETEHDAQNRLFYNIDNDSHSDSDSLSSFDGPDSPLESQKPANSSHGFLPSDDE